MLSPKGKEINEQKLLEAMDPDKMPLHVAVIMDGNRRWAQTHKLPTIAGHEAGVKAFKNLVKNCIALNIRHLTAYAFSSENWHRSKTEINLIFSLFEYYARRERASLKKNGVQFKIIGDLSPLPLEARKSLLQTAEATQNNSALNLNLAVNYGSRNEILRAVELWSRQSPREPLTEESFSRFLYTAGTPDPELLIRTSGELRISNFLLWQAAYAEFYFTPLCWPDFDKIALLQAILEFQQRRRRFGS